ncbi:MAG TPA: protein kinase [Thermoanaerobaculia bacterium]|nr:protein kinase [Thermoanaerobaculia bacterium]
MILQRGTSISHYQIDSLLGEGGMGEVYRARDSQLERDVAMKILPAELVRDPDRVRRFVQEAKTASALNHPHIVAIFEIGRHDEIEYIAMELIDGRTLRDAIHVQKLPLRKLTELIAQAADAVAKAHASGVIHRDLKPDNIMISRDGYAKVLDFGLAKLTEVRTESVSGEVTSVQADHTRDGVVLGTPAYMSPEQAQGKTVDHRSDIFSLGCILYEAATRKKAFDGDSDLTVLHKIAHEEPRAVSAVNPAVPPPFSRIIRRCLAKDPDDRFQSMKDVAIELRDIVRDFEALAAPPAPARRMRIAAAGTGLLVVIAAIVAAVRFIPRHHAERVIESTLNLPGQWSVTQAAAETSATTRSERSIALSPDGSKIVFAASTPAKGSMLWLRRLDTPDAMPIEGTQNGLLPFWSPDGERIAFFADRKLKMIATSGGVAETICEVSFYHGGTWNRDGVILFGDKLAGPAAAIYRVPATGGRTVPVTTIDVSAGERAHAYPAFLPDGRHFLFTSRVVKSDGREDWIEAGSLDGGPPKRLMLADSNALYAEPGFLLFIRGHSLMAQAFDADQLALSGEAKLLASHVGRATRIYDPASGSFSVSKNGYLVFQADRGPESSLVVFDRMGRKIRTLDEAGNFLDPALSHDGRHLAVTIVDADDNPDIWLIDLERSTRTRLTTDPMNDMAPVFSPDDARIVFGSNRGQSIGFRLYEKELSGTSGEHPFALDTLPVMPEDWSPDGKSLAFQTWRKDQQWDLLIASITTGKSFPVATTQFDEDQGRFSPDGRWIAYVSDENGRDEVYVQSLSSAHTRWQVSTNGGDMPQWRRDGKELFFYAPDGNIVSVSVRATPQGLTFGAPIPLFNVRLRWGVNAGFCVTADGQQFIANVVNPAPEPPFTLVQNWPSLLNRQ